VTIIFKPYERFPTHSGRVLWRRDDQGVVGGGKTCRVILILNISNPLEYSADRQSSTLIGTERGPVDYQTEALGKFKELRNI